MPSSSRLREAPGSRPDVLLACTIGWVLSLSTSAANGADPAAIAAAAALPATSASAEDTQDTLLAVIVNGEAMPATRFLQRPDGHLYARPADLVRWRFGLPDTGPIDHDGESYLPLDAVAGLRYRIDAATQTLHIETGAGNFMRTVVTSDRRQFAAPPPPPVGGFFNYDLSAQTADHRSSSGGLFEAVGFSPWGTVAGTAVARSGMNAGVVRLDTTWTLDRPADLASLRVGDAISRGGSWSQPVRFAGLQYATNFGTQPGFVTFPLPSFAGEAALPSTVDLYVNDALRLRSNVPAGPFSVPQLPVVTGSGETRIVVSDLLGRQRTIVTPFYASSQLLQPGLRDFSYEVGALRANYGTASNDYGPVVAVGTERRGLTDSFTGEVHGEIGRDRQAAGLGAVWLWPVAGVFTASVGGSHSDQGIGELLSLGFQRQTHRLSIGGNFVATSARFVPLGLPSDPPAPKRLEQAYASYSTESYGSLGVSYVRRDFRDRTNVELLGASYGIGLGRYGYLSATVLRDVRGGQTFAALTYSVPLDATASLSASATAQGDSRYGQVQVQRNLPSGSGYGYRLVADAGSGNSDRAEADLLLQDEHGTYGFDAAVSDGRGAFRAEAAGGIAMIGSSIFASRVIDQSFSIVEVPGFPDVRVYAANQVVGRTDSSGAALVPRLLPFEKNPIRIEQADLPLDVTVDSLSVDVVPGFRSGAVVHFPIRRSRGGLIKLVLDDGQPVPVGTVATLEGNPEAFPAGQDGEIYLTGLEPENAVQVTWRDQRCDIRVPFPDTRDPLPQLGTFICHGVKR